MTHPYIHAQSSARVFGGDANQYLYIHQWLDATKVTVCDYRHRYLRHHVEGIDELIQQEGKYIVGDGFEAKTRAVAEQHLIEDCGGRIPTLADWLAELKAPEWAQSVSTLEHTGASASKWGGSKTDYFRIHSWFDEAVERHGAAGLAYRNHAFGIFEAETRFGMVITNSDGKTVPVRYIGEQHVLANCGMRVPSVQDWVQCMSRKMWMSHGTPTNLKGSTC